MECMESQKVGSCKNEGGGGGGEGDLNAAIHFSFIRFPVGSLLRDGDEEEVGIVLDLQGFLLLSL